MAHWVSAWGQASTDICRVRPVWRDRTCLVTVLSPFDGAAVRLRLSNRDGRRALTVAAATVAVGGARPVRLRFGGADGLVLAPEEEAYADPLETPVRRGDPIGIRMAFRGPVGAGNTVPASVLCSVAGDYTAGGPFDTVRGPAGPAVPAIASVEVLAPDSAGALVCFGDSITQMGMWTEPLRAALWRLRPGALSLVNKGIGGNRVLHGPASELVRGYGRAGVERFGRDALDEAGAAAVILSIGTNDIGHVGDPAHPEWTDAGMLAAALAGLAGRVRERGLAVYGATVPPCMGCEGFGPGQEAQRAALNAWLREDRGAVFDRVLDFDAVLRDPDRPDRLEMSRDSGDHLHPGPLGGLRMAGEVLEKLL